jgi:hypothetical protein
MMLNARKKIMALTLVATLGTAAFAQNSAQDLGAIAAAVWVAEGIGALLSLGVDLVVAGVKGGKTVYTKMSKSDYPELKPGINCFGLDNASTAEWTIRVPKGDDPAEKKNPDLKEIKNQSGNIKVYSIVRTKDKKGIEKIIFLGDLTGDKSRTIAIMPGDDFILYADNWFKWRDDQVRHVQANDVRGSDRL